jgi:hypothetical protein
LASAFPTKGRRDGVKCAAFFFGCIKKWFAVKQSEALKEASSSDFQGPIPTFGEVFSGGMFVELVRTGGSVRPSLLLWDSRAPVVGQVIEFQGRRYEPRAIHDTVLRELKLPASVGSNRSVRELLAEICKLIDRFVGLPEKSAPLVGRFILATWLVDAMQTAPRLLIEGPDTARARQLIQLLHCSCRRALPMSALTPAGLCSLPSGLRLTLLLQQEVISPKLAALLKAATVRGNPVLRAGQLRDLFGAQVVLCDAGYGEETWVTPSIRAPCMPTAGRLPVLNIEQQQRISEDLQDRLLAFRFSNYQAACDTSFDSSKLAIPLQALSASLAAATPGDVELHGELHTLLQEENAEMEAANWVDPNTVIIEAILVHCREAKVQCVYVGEIAEMASKILQGRGESRSLDPGETGRRIKSLGFATEPRDARGVKLRVTNAVCVLAHNLAHQLDVPAARECDCRGL